MEVLEANNKDQKKALGKISGETDFKNKVNGLNEEVKKVKQAYREAERSHKEKELKMKAYYDDAQGIEDEFLRMKRQVIELSNKHYVESLTPA